MGHWDIGTLGYETALEQYGVKQAGIRDALRVALTGRVPLYHGTQKEYGKRILQEGIQPGASKGVSDMIPGLKPMEEGIGFATRSPAQGKMYATQAAGIKRLDNLPEGLRKRLPDSVLEHVDTDSPVKMQLARLAGILPGGGKQVMKAHVPRKELAKMETGIPELEVNQALTDARENLTNVLERQLGYNEVAGGKSLGSHAADYLTTKAFAPAVALKGGLPSKYIKGAPDYQGYSLSEFKDHLGSIRQDPTGYLKDIARAGLERSHSPQTMLDMSESATANALKRQKGPGAVTDDFWVDHATRR